MQPHTLRQVTLFLRTILFVLVCSGLQAQSHSGPVAGGGDHAKTIPLREMVPLKAEQGGHREKPIRLLPPLAGPSGPVADPALQTLAVKAPTVGNVNSFDGIGQGAFGFVPSVAPPDTNGSVGETQYVQWVNESFAVFNKTTGALLFGPAAGNTLFQALGAAHPCAVNNDGDPIAQYDKAAKRWVLTQFSVTGGAVNGFWQCVAVSQTSDATGAYNVYAFNYGTAQFNDYPKLGVWSDAYYVTYNIFTGAAFAGSKLCALDRAAMLAGAPANQICFQLSPAFGGVLPADLDGVTPPPAGSPAYFMNFSANSLNLWRMSNLNFVAGTATLTGPVNLPVAAFTPACNGGACIRQLNTPQQLDSLGDRLMYRLAYRNFGDHEALVVNHSVAVGGATGVRWYEIRSPGSAPAIFQQGTFAPDGNYRWMGSAAMDHTGDIAMGYSVSSSTLNPGIRFTARAPGDPLGTMAVELTIKNGTGSQLANLSRWGDYSNISVDPLDDCTFWYTTEYLQADGTFNWSTRIANFKFAGCTPDFTLAATPSSRSIGEGASTTYTVGVTPVGAYTGTVTFSAGGLPSGAAAAFTPAGVSSSGSAVMTITTSPTTPAGSYALTITGTDGTLTHSAAALLVINPPPDFSASATPATQTVAQGSSVGYTATIAATGGYSGAVSFSVSGLPPGATGVFAPPGITTSGSATLTVSTLATTPTGSFPLTITATDGVITHTASVTLVVVAPAAGDFTIGAFPPSQSVSAGLNSGYGVTVGSLNGFADAVILSVTGLPAGATAVITPGSIAGAGTATITVNTLTTTPVGSYNLVVTGTSGALSHTSTVTLVVTAAVPPPPPPPPPPITATVSVAGNVQVPVPNVGQAGNIVWTISDTTTTVAPNVVFQTGVPSNATAAMQLNSITVTENNSGVFVCTFTPTGGAPVPCAAAPVGNAGGVIQVTTPSLGGSTKNGNKPPQTMIVTVNVTNPAGTTRGTVFNSTGTMTFGPGGVDTLPGSVTVTITSN